MAHSITRSALRPGDILLSAGVGKTSEAIRAFDGGQYSHAALWTGEDIIESTTPHVVRHSLGDSLAAHPRRYVDSYRHKTPEVKGTEVVTAAEQYLDRRYSYGDLALGALVLGTTAWLPTTASQEKALLALCELNRLLELVRGQEGKLVTCTELVARAYFEAGVPILVIPKGGNRFNREAVSALLQGAGELWQEGASKLSVSSDFQDDWRAMQRQLRLLTLGHSDPSEDALIELSARKLAAMVAGGEWGANLVTPSYLESSPDLTLVGRLYAAPGDEISSAHPPS